MGDDLKSQWMMFGIALGLLGVGCGEEPKSRQEILGGEIQYEKNRPSVGDGESQVEPYTGSNEHVLTAQQKFRTPLDLHRKVIQRTCSPTGGVCHNQKEYPDLHTPANFLATVEAPCNAQPGELSSVFDRCEKPGDRFAFRDRDFKEIEIGHIERVKGASEDYDEEENPPGADSPGLHIYLYKPVPMERDHVYATGQFIRTFVNDEGNVQDLAFANYRSSWWVLDDGKHLMAEVNDYQADRVNELLSVGITQGDLNQNGDYGARKSEPISLLEPGNPEESYLIGRLRGSMKGQKVPGTRMPLANQPLSIPEMLALYCFVEGVPKGIRKPPEGTSPIDYKNCSYSENPEELNLLGEGVTWSGRVSKILEANCGGCHGGGSPSADFDVLGEDAYTSVLSESTQKEGMKRIEPGKPEESYLWLKLNARNNEAFDEKITGQAMPINPIDGQTTLSDAERADIKTWIENGAQDE